MNSQTQEVKGGIRVKILSSLQEQPTESRRVFPDGDVIVLSSDSEPPPQDVVPPSLRRRKRKKNLLEQSVKMEEESLSSTQSKPLAKNTKKQQKIEAVASQCYKIQDYFNPVTKDEWEVTVRKNIREVLVDPPSERKQKSKAVKTDENAPLRQFSSTRARNPVTNIFIRRKLGRSTNLKMFGKRNLTGQQKRIQNYFAVHRGSTFRSYYDTFKESLFPVMISGDIDVDNFLSRLREATEGADELFQYTVKKEQLVVRPKKGCSFDDEVHLMDVLEETMKKEELDLEVNPECRKNGSSRASTSRDSAVSLTEPVDDPIVAEEAQEEDVVPETPPSRTRRKRKVVCPPFKIIKGTTFAVDAFRYGVIEKVTSYFLTHFHADHYIGLRKSFDRPLYLTSVTGNLVRSFVGVDEKYLNEMTYNTPVMVEGVEVTAINANHCPGAAMFFFKLPSGETILHTGDFRASHLMEMHPIFWNNSIDTVYLDTTYLSSQTRLPTQEESIEAAIQETEKFSKKNIGEKWLVIVGTYLVGKEKVWHALATRFGLRVWLEPQRRKAVECIGDAELIALLCEDPREAQLHVLPLGQLSYEYVVKYMSQFEREFTHVLALRPSGWEVNSRPRHQGRISLVGVTYSEHSSYTEMRRFVRFLRPHHVIPTVNAEGVKSDKVPEKWLSRAVEPWRESQHSTITRYFPLRGRPKVGEELEGETENLTQLSLIGHCDPADLALSTTTDWTF